MDPDTGRCIGSGNGEGVLERIGTFLAERRNCFNLKYAPVQYFMERAAADGETARENEGEYR